MAEGNVAVITLIAILLSVCVEDKQAANVGGGELLNGVGIITTTTATTAVPTSPSTTPGLLVSGFGTTNFTVQAGTRVSLLCQVNYLADNATVSWLRRLGDSLTLLTVGTEVYSGDQRYTATFTSPRNWNLVLEAVNQTDEGYYECQVTSHPPIVRSIYLHVVVPELEIADERSLPIKNKFYNSGSTIELRCVITKIPQPTQFITWRHNSTILNYDTTRGGISVKTDILPDGAKSQLFIANVRPSDSGNYTCSLGEVAVTSVSVVVITGETPAAMQHGTAWQRNSGVVLLLLTMLVHILNS
ncbi:opioid-binding protein/cell adhesion molecule-like [Rhodnius prolixus]|uniref:opioid-binding protein/cell adhesion molecule-like n=1 Tax=Rhodnius prolixus TaxID=13249 RepID=UPI003D18CCE1